MFYAKLMKNMPLLSAENIGFPAIKAKLNALKTSYTKMFNWRNQTGAGLEEDGKAETVRGKSLVYNAFSLLFF